MIRRSQSQASTATPSPPKPSTSSAKKTSKKEDAADGVERYDKFYAKFERPPFAQIYRPTEEEFLDPIAYVAKIRHEAERYGVVKIVPPPSFKPPFALDRDAFTFRPRIQRLNEIEAIVKEKATFIERVVNYNRMNGYSDYVAIDPHGHPIDLHHLHKVVTALKGFDVVTKQCKWADVAEKVCRPARSVPPQYDKFLRSHYADHIIGFLNNVKDEDKDLMYASDEDESADRHKYQHHHGIKVKAEDDDDDVKPESPCSPTMQGRRRASGGMKSRMKASTRPGGRMMAGLAPREEKRLSSPPSTSRKGRKTKDEVKKEMKEEVVEDDPVNSVYCLKCGRGDDENSLLLCELPCYNGIHTFCCDPPLKTIPEGEWRCPTCVKAIDATIGADWGFYDDQQSTYSLNQFAEFASQYKCDYFHARSPNEVASQHIEAEFWKNVVADKETVVKYGADLITSEVGSGFPRRGDDHHAFNDWKARETYADHMWNLNNLPVLKESVLSHIDIGISGMMVPWVYVGMCFSTFCWHTEDHWTYSINYNHWGERKVWYGIGGEHAEKFESAVRSLAPGITGRQRDLFHHMTTAVNPALLRKHGVPVHMVHQNAGEFVITFPRAYHAGFNEGFNFAEAVNFAPFDWLSKGRLCVGEYAAVRRCCVFSHDELVVKIAHDCEKLNISTSLATLDELVTISKREHELRMAVQKAGIRKQRREQFEEKPDDCRACRVCKTTVYLSAITCVHGKIACLQHYDLVCKTCPPAQRQLLYRFQLEELVPLMTKLELRTTQYNEWKKDVDDVIQQHGKKIRLDKLDELCEMARKERFPITESLRTLGDFRTQARAAIDKTNQLLNGKMRTRVRTRIQRADTRLDVDGLKRFINEMRRMPCDLSAQVKNLEGLLIQILEWQQKAQKVIREVADFDGSGQLASADDVERLVDAGNEFDLRIPEHDELKKALEIREWQTMAERILSWTVRDNMEDEPNFETRQRWDQEFIVKLVTDGTRLISNPSPDSPASQLHARMRRAMEHENEAREFLAKPRVNNFQSVWSRVRHSDWYSAKNIDELRVEVLRMSEVHKQLLDALHIAEPNTHELHALFESHATQLSISDVSASTVADLIGQCDRSRILRESVIYSTLCTLRTQLDTFTTRMCRLFKPPHAYYNLVEVVGERDDLAVLAEGQAMARELEPTASSPAHEWRQLDEFDSGEQLLARQRMLREQHQRLLGALQRANEQRSVAETCVCAGGHVERQADEVRCLVCRAKYHVACCEWSPVLGGLPSGAFLCVRCLRGRRPLLPDVENALAIAPPNSFEAALVRDAIERTQSCSRAVLEQITAYQLQSPPSGEAKLKLRWAIEAFLSCEVVNPLARTRTWEVLPSVFDDICTSQTKAVGALKSRPARSHPLPLLFAHGNGLGKEKLKGKRLSSANKEYKREKKRGRVYHEDDELCAADLCLNPFGEQVMWVQCEAGCDRWYHCVCVGLQRTAAMSDEVYACLNCSTATSSTSSTTSPAPA